MLRKEQVATLVSIAVVSFLIGTTFHVVTVAKKDDGGNPVDEIWEAVYGLESQIHECQVRLPKVITLYELERVYIPGDDGWHDVVCIPNVSITEGSDVVAIAHVGIDDGYIKLRVRANSTFRGWHRIDRVGPSYAYGEFHVVFADMPAGTYAFAILGRTTYPSNLGVHTRRLTLIITQDSQ